MTEKSKVSQLGKVPPQNVEAEQSVLGALLIDKEAIFKVSNILQPDDFYRDDHRQIYRAIMSLSEKRVPVDLVTLTEELRSTKELDVAGGATYLAYLANQVLSSAHVVQHGEIVSQKSVLRRLIQAATRIIEQSYDESGDVGGIIDKSEQALFQVSERFVTNDFIPIKDVLSETFERINELHENKGQLRGVTSGFKDLDNLLAGFQKSDLVILAARPSMGKTSLALNIALNASRDAKVPVGIFSLEMSRDQLVDSLLTIEAGIDSWRLRTGNLREDDFQKINYAMGILSESPIFIDDSPLMTVMDIRAKARRLQAENGLGMIIVDYLQLIDSKNSSSDSNRVQEVSEISRGLKALARELAVPLVAISQLSRAVEARPDKRPMLSDLRESGSIEQDADVVMFIYREDYYDPDTERKGVTQILIRKHRNGPIGEIDLYFHPEFRRFVSLENKRNT